MDEFLEQEYVLVDSENFEDYLIFLGISYIARKAALSLRPRQLLTKDNEGRYTLSFKSKLVNSTVSFVPGQEFDEVKPDGVKVRASIEFEGNKLIHTQTEANGRTAHHIRQFFADKMIMTTTANGFDKTAVRYFELVK
ncbi:unnamed protein product [Pieris macdunnoughi]|uniref:Uncharacterized protein n=1 Tax=Pieris macdunnoughi TaxID=345717 RepID=A0A821PA98_9NEOP|nr:unnamed protein product [Pieris macdunnoughi]